MLPSGFEPESKPREGFMIGRYTTGAFFIRQKQPVLSTTPDPQG
jgi:hypothetical protein